VSVWPPEQLNRVRSRKAEIQAEIDRDDAVEYGMTHLSGYDRSQLLLLPEAVDGVETVVAVVYPR
jgi:hypothetical protein